MVVLTPSGMIWQTRGLKLKGAWGCHVLAFRNTCCAQLIMLFSPCGSLAPPLCFFCLLQEDTPGQCCNYVRMHKRRIELGLALWGSHCPTSRQEEEIFICLSSYYLSSPSMVLGVFVFLFWGNLRPAAIRFSFLDSPSLGLG